MKEKILRWRRVLPTLGAGAFLMIAGCRSHDPILFDSQGRPLAQAEPVAYRIAVAPFEIAPGLEATPDVTGLKRNAAELQGDLVDALRDIHAASEVFAVSSALSYEAYSQDADLMVRPRLEESAFSHEGASGRAVLSSVLWFTTWIGSLWVEDSSYNARFLIRYDLVEPHTGMQLANNLEARSEQVDLSFWDRNAAFSKGFFASMLVPPYLTGDDQELTSAALIRRSNARVAAQLKTYLKETLPNREQELLAQVQIKSPRNGSQVTGQTPLRCDIIAKRVVTEVQVFVNGGLRQKWLESELPSLSEQAKGAFFLCPVRVDDLELNQPGKNLIRLLVNVAGQWASRSLVVYTEAEDARERNVES